MDLLAVLRAQHATRFRDVAGANATVMLPISDRLVSRLVAESLPPGGAVRGLDLRAHASNRFVVRIRLSRPAFLPSIAITAFIQRQPELPGSPVLVFRLAMPGGLLGLAGPAVRMMGALPPGIQLEGDRLEVDVRSLLERYGAAEALDYINDLRVTTEEDRFVLSVQASVPRA
jgi:hypothetical protein